MTPEHGWTCFHCGETFKTYRDARDHFGFDQADDPACLIKAGAEGSLVTALRRAEQAASDAWLALHNENSDFAKAYHAQASRHHQQLRAVEESAYERGLRDGKGAGELPKAAKPKPSTPWT